MYVNGWSLICHFHQMMSLTMDFMLHVTLIIVTFLTMGAGAWKFCSQGLEVTVF